MLSGHVTALVGVIRHPGKLSDIPAVQLGVIRHVSTLSDVMFQFADGFHG